MHLTVIGKHEPEAEKDKNDDTESEDGDHMTKSIPTNNHIPHSEEDSDSDKSDDNEDTTWGPFVSEREKTNAISEDSKDSEDSGDS